jgi:Co/Zn/Cd efflux system component
MNPDHRIADNLRSSIEREGDTLTDLHVWRLRRGQLHAIISVATHTGRGSDYYRAKRTQFRSLLAPSKCATPDRWPAHSENTVNNRFGRRAD